MKRASWILLGAALLVACGGGPERPPEMAFSAAQSFNPLEICETTNYSRFARGATCKDHHLLFVSREPNPSDMLALWRRRLSLYGYAANDLTFRVNGQNQPVLEYQMGPGTAPAVHAFVTALAVPGTSESVEAHCYSFGRMAKAKRCANLLDAFVAQGLLRGEWPEVLHQGPRNTSIVLDVAGRDVRLPASCDELGPFDLACREGHVRVLISDSPDKLATVERVDLEASKDPTLIRERTVPCALEGVPTTCTLRRSRLPYQDELLSYRASAVVRGQALFVACEAQKSRINPVPGPICGQFFWFDEGVLDEPPILDEAGP